MKTIPWLRQDIIPSIDQGTWDIVDPGHTEGLQTGKARKLLDLSGSWFMVLGKILG